MISIRKILSIFKTFNIYCQITFQKKAYELVFYEPHVRRQTAQGNTLFAYQSFTMPSLHQRILLEEKFI